MSKQKKKTSTTEKIVLATTILQLIHVILELIKDFIG